MLQAPRAGPYLCFFAPRSPPCWPRRTVPPAHCQPEAWVVQGHSRDLWPCPLSSCCGREAIGPCRWDQPGQRPSWLPKGEGLGQQDSPGEQTLEQALSGSWLFSQLSTRAPGLHPHLGCHGLCDGVLAKGKLRTRHGPEPSPATLLSPRALWSWSPDEHLSPPRGQQLGNRVFSAWVWWGG